MGRRDQQALHTFDEPNQRLTSEVGEHACAAEGGEGWHNCILLTDRGCGGANSCCEDAFCLRGAEMREHDVHEVEQRAAQLIEGLSRCRLALWQGLEQSKAGSKCGEANVGLLGARGEFFAGCGRCRIKARQHLRDERAPRMALRLQP